MIPALLILLFAQLAGETLVRVTGLPLPGPVAGMVLMLLGFAFVPGLADRIRPLATGILGNLSLLFVPAGTGVIGHFDRLSAQGPALLVTIVASTILAIAAGALAFSAVAKLIRLEPEA